VTDNYSYFYLWTNS